jgi:glycosyltransferase involved in cell wall biosynthesis
VDQCETSCLPKVSAIIPTFNGAAYICQTIESLLTQTVAFDELIIIDDCSNDGTPAVIEKLLADRNPRLRIVFERQTVNLGPSRVRDLGQSLTRNDHILYMDQDDIAEPTMLEEEGKRLAALGERDYVLVHSACSQIDESGRFIAGIHRWRQVGVEEILGYEFVRNQILSMSGVLIKKECLIKVGGFDPGLRYSQDWDLWLKLARQGGFGYVDQPLVRVRRHGGNTSADINGFLADERKVLEKYNLDFIQAAINKRRLPSEDNYLDFATVLFKLDQVDAAYEWLQKAVRRNPELSSGYFYLGIYYLRKKCLPKAEQAFKKVLASRPDDAAVQNNLGCIKALNGDTRAAEELFRKAITQVPNYMDAALNLQAIENNAACREADVRFTWRELRPALLTYRLKTR